MIIDILLIVSVLVSQTLDKQRLQTYTSFDSTNQEKTKLKFFFVPTVYAGEMTISLVNNACTLTDFQLAYQQFQKRTDINSYKQQTFKVYGFERQQKLFLFPALP